MKRKLTIPVLLVLIMLITIALYNKDKTAFAMLAVPTIYSRYHSDDLETVYIEVMVTNKDHYYLEEEYIVQSRLTNDEQVVAVDVINISRSDEVFVHNNTSYYPVTFAIRLEVRSREQLIQMDEATLELVYGNEDRLEVMIGEFNYLFHEALDEALISGSVSALYETINGVETVAGLNIELYNRSNQLIDVQSIDVLSTSTSVNKGMVQPYRTCDEKMSITTCLGVQEYEWFNEPGDVPLHITISPNQEMELFVPFSYRDCLFLHRFVMVVSYRHNGIEKTMIIDDLPYLKTSLFQERYNNFFVEYHEFH